MISGAAGIAFALACVGWVTTAQAFHAGNVFDKPAGAGGGGGIFYTGAKSERGWNCSACHTDAAGKIKVTLAADPPALLQTMRYEPGKTYAIKATLDGEHLGAGAANFNSIAVALVSDDGAPAGELSGYAADELYAGRTTLASAGQRPGQTSWSFKWTAPTAGAAPVQLHVAAVDGNGADGEGGGTLTDPWGDDVFVGAITLRSGAQSRVPWKGSSGNIAAAGLFAVACVFVSRRKQGGTR